MSKGSSGPKLVAAVAVAAIGTLGWFGWKWIDGPERHDAKPAIASGGAARATAPAEKAEGAEAKAPTTTATRAVEAPPPPPPPLESAMPASYRKALSGVRGRLVDADGKPVAGLGVELLEMLPSSFMGDYASVFSGAPPKFPELTVAKGKSGDDGVFVLEGTHGAAMHAVGVDLGGPRGTLRVVDRTLPSGEVVDLGDIALGACVTFKGTVADEDGKPVAGARVRATTLPAIVFQPGVADVARAAGLLPRSGVRGAAEMVEFPEGLRAWESRLPLPTTRTGADGTFELSGVPQGIVTLVVDSDGFCGTFKGPSPTGKRDRDVGTIELSRGRELRGVVVDAAGKPVANADVFGGVEIPAARMSVLFKGAPTGPDGRFRIEHLSPLAGALSVVARANALQIATVQTVEDPDRDVTVTLPGACSLAVTLKAKRDGAPVGDAGAELWLNTSADFPVLTFAPPRRVPQAQIEPVAPGRFVIHGLAPGRCSLFARVAGMARASKTCEVTAEATAEATLEFVPAATLDVEVVDATTQAPIEWASVSSGEGRSREVVTIARRTNAEGKAQLPEMPAVEVKEKSDVNGTWVRAFHPAYAPQTLPMAFAADGTSAPAPLRFELRPGAALKGRVHVGSGAPTEPVIFMLESRNYGRTSIDDLFPRMAVPGLDGTFEIKGLAPGTTSWTVMTRLFGGDAASSLEKIPSVATLKSGSVTLEEGKTAEVDVDLDPRMQDAPCKITGTVHVHGARRPGTLRFEARTQPMARGGETKQDSTEVRPEQPFTLEIPGGWINADLVEQIKDAQPPQTRQLYQTWFQLDPGQAHDLTIDLEFVTAKLLVVDADGNPAPHLSVMLNAERSEANSGDPSASVNAWGQTGDDGVAEVELSRRGNWHCQVTDAKAGRGSGTFDFPSTRVERIVLSRGVPCGGRIEIVDDPGGDLSFYLQLQRVSENESVSSDDYMGIQLDKGVRTFDIVGLSPGRYRVNLWGNRYSRDEAVIDLTSAGRSDLVLRFKLDPPRKDGNE
jgi:hypothetical protein